MKRITVLLMTGVLVVLLGACGQTQGGNTGTGAATTAAPATEAAATEAPATEAATAEAATTEAATTEAAATEAATMTMDHSAMSASDHAAMTAGQPFDLLFIDSMIPHHQGAIKMAQQALEQAEHQEIKTMAQAVVDAQQQEIGQMQEWRMAWYTDTAPTAGMGMDMGMMEVPAGEQPFDLRFIDAMIPHHAGAIAMAQEALNNAEHDEVKTLAQEIIDTQQQEIAQLQEWRAAWYPDAQ